MLQLPIRVVKREHQICPPAEVVLLSHTWLATRAAKGYYLGSSSCEHCRSANSYIRKVRCDEQRPKCMSNGLLVTKAGTVSNAFYRLLMPPSKRGMVRYPTRIEGHLLTAVHSQYKERATEKSAQA